MWTFDSFGYELSNPGRSAKNPYSLSLLPAIFEGNKQSGLGREDGFDGIRELLQSKYIGVDIQRFGKTFSWATQRPKGIALVQPGETALRM